MPRDLPCRAPHLPTEFVISKGSNAGSFPGFLKTALQQVLLPKDERPVCIVLPDTGELAVLLAIFSALEFLRDDFPGSAATYFDRLQPGDRVRILPQGYVYEFGDKTTEYGTLGIWRYFTNAANRREPGRIFLPSPRALRYERTEARQPVSHQGQQLGPDPTCPLDRFSGTKTFGNTSLFANRVILLGTRPDLMGVLNTLRFSTTNQQAPGLPSPENWFPWGFIDSEGSLNVESTAGSMGDPLIAISPDLSRIGTLLNPEAAPRQRLVVTDRLSLIAGNRDAAARIAEFHRMILLVPAQQREEAIELRAAGWRVRELSPSDIATECIPGTVTGFKGIDRTIQSASAERNCEPHLVSCQNDHLEMAFSALDELDRALGNLVQDDPITAEVVGKVRRLYFLAAAWVRVPVAGEFAEVIRDLLNGEGNRDRNRLRVTAGPEAADAFELFSLSIRDFIRQSRAGAITEKGEALLRQVQHHQDAGINEMSIITGLEQSRQEIETLLTELRQNLRCYRASKRSDDVKEASILVSLLNRDYFKRAIDPWPAQHVALIGYRHEIEIYGKRLNHRQLSRARLIDDGDLPLPPSEGPLDLRSRTPIQISAPVPMPGDETRDARLVRFANNSFMPMTPDHRCLVIASEAQTKPRLVGLAGLSNGDRIVVRDGSDRDVVRLFVEQRIGHTEYQSLRAKASLWRHALTASRLGIHDIRRRLADSGFSYHRVTIDQWISNEDIIAPQRLSAIDSIAELFPLQGATANRWEDCKGAVRKLRGLHISAGSALTDILTRRLSDVDVDPSHSEVALRLDLGTLWVLQVNQIDPAAVQWPASLVNRLDWDSDAWRDLALDHAINIDEVDDTAQLPDPPTSEVELGSELVGTVGE